MKQNTLISLIISILIILMVFSIVFNFEFGGVIIVGFIPIVFGNNVYLIIISFILAVVLLIVRLIFTKADISKNTQNSDFENKLHQLNSEIKQKSTKKGGGLIMIGPLPIIFGTNKRIIMTLTSIAISIIIILIYFKIKK